MLTPDLDLARRFISAHPPPGRLLLCGITGAHHYRGYFRGMCHEHQSRPEPRAKSMLYSYRVALTGIHLMRTGELEADIGRLARMHGFPSIAEVAAFKREHGEKCPLPGDLDRRHRAGWQDLGDALDAAVHESALPSEAPNRDAIDQWLVALRVAEI